MQRHTVFETSFTYSTTGIRVQGGRSLLIMTVTGRTLRYTE
jgi:hypothetical protein